MDKYKIVKYGDIESINKWYHECEKAPDHPYILVITGRKYARVEFDYISMDGKYDDWLFKGTYGGDILKRKHIDTFKKYACKKSHYNLSASLVTYENILIENAEALAAELYDNVKTVIDKYPKGKFKFRRDDW